MKALGIIINRNHPLVTHESLLKLIMSLIKEFSFTSSDEFIRVSERAEFEKLFVRGFD